MLKREKIDLSIERRVLSNLVMSTPLLAQCVKAGDPSLFESTMGRIVATWVWEYYARIGEAPGKTINDMYRRRAKELKDADAELVFEFLSACSDEWLPTNIDYATDMALKYFQGRSLARLSEKLARAVESGDVQSGFHAVSEFIKPDVRKMDAADIFNDSGAVTEAFSDEDEEVFSLPGELGHVIGPFIKEDFAAFIAPPKRGKTWWLMVCAVAAALIGCRVLYISLEMPKKQMIRRFWQMLTGTSRYGEEAPWPIFKETEDNTFEIIDGKMKTTKVDSSSDAVEKLQASIRRVSRTGRLELRSFPTGSLSIKELESELKDMEAYENFVPQVIIIDYADIMDLGRGDSERDKLNRCWLALRGLAMNRKAVVITASQTGRETVGGEKDASEKNVSEDIRKMGHVTKMITINQTEEEQARGIYRIACKTQREGQVIHDQVVCTSCLAIGRPYLECQLLSRVDMGNEELWKDESDEKPRSGRRNDPRRRRR